jgi:uncharacterized protein (TIGR03083 family)
VQLTPRYGEPAVLDVQPAFGDAATPLLRQRARLAATLAGLDADQWAAPSRCAGWSVQDVITHLVTTNQFWAFSLRSALDGTPTRLLATFDPVASPAEMVAAARSQTAGEELATFVDSNGTLSEAVAAIGDDGWSTPGEAPPGHVPLHAVALHALWDAWVHERDVVLPLGLAPVEEDDEVAGCLAYAAALGPTLAVTRGETRRGTLAVRATDPDVHLVVEAGESVVVRTGDAPAGAPCLTGPAVDLVEALSFRAPLPCPAPEADSWLLAGLAEVFDRRAP